MANAFLALRAEPVITREPEAVRKASIVVFPGQGAAPPAMRSLRESGLGEALVEAVLAGVPTLGICLGMQLALERTDEGPTQCLGLIAGTSVRIEPVQERSNRDPAAHVSLQTKDEKRETRNEKRLKVPQIGWNTVSHRADGLFEGIPDRTYFYFVHSYYCQPDPTTVIGCTDYGVKYCSALQSGQFWATQFHPEKSGPSGLRLLSNFLARATC